MVYDQSGLTSRVGGTVADKNSGEQSSNRDP